MPSVILQDLNAVVHGTSKHGLDYDIAHVTMLMQTDTPIPPESQWYIPHVENIPKEALSFINDGKTPIYPMLKETSFSGTSDIIEEAQRGDTASVIDDAKKLIFISSMQPTTIEPLENNNCCYVISYKYRLYPVSPNTFDFKVLLPFDGLTLYPSGGKLQVTLVAPIGAKIIPEKTDARNLDGQPVANEAITPIALVNKNVVSFEIHQDPIFTITYTYN